MKTIQLTCGWCAQTFSKPLKEVTRQRKKGREIFFCNLSCSANACLVPHSGPHDPTSLLKRAYRREPDAFSPFRWFLKCAKQRGLECDLTLETLKEMWDAQRGICPFTGWLLKLPYGASRRDKLHPDSASLDRIDSTKGYLKSNVRFVSVMANYARNRFTDQDVVNFAKAVVGSLS